MEIDLSHLEEAWTESRARPPRQTARTMPPGIYLDIPFDDYASIPAVNFSRLKLAKRSMAHYCNSPAREETPAFRFGSLFHCGHLEPKELGSRYVVTPDQQFIEQVQQERVSAGEEPYAKPTATKRFAHLRDQFLLAHPGKQQVSEAWMGNVQGMLDSIHENTLANVLFTNGHPEVTCIANDPSTGLLLKSRIDFLRCFGYEPDELGFPLGIPDPGEAMCDLKTAQDPFKWKLEDLDYHLQAGFYELVYQLAYAAMPAKSRKKRVKFPDPKFGTLPFWFVVVEKTTPWTVLAAPVSNRVLEASRTEVRFLLDKVAEAHGTGQWPKAPNPEPWDFSPWFKPMEFPLAQMSGVDASYGSKENPSIETGD